MKNKYRKFALMFLTGVLAVGSMSGCSKKVDGTKTVASVNEEEVKLGTVNLMLRYQQAQTTQMYEMYFGGSDSIWDTVNDEESGETYGEQTVKDTLDEIIDMVILRQHAGDYKISISDEEQKKIEDAAKSFFEANDTATLEKLGVAQEQVEELLELNYYKTFLYDPITADVDMNVSDEEAAQTGITYVEISEDSEETDGEEASGEDDAGENTEKEMDAKTKAQQILDQILATADADMDAIAKSVDENLSATTVNFTTNPDEEEADSSSVPTEVQDAVKELTDGEVASELVEADGAYYVVRLDAAFDEEATENQKTTIQNERKQDFYDETTEKWKDDSKITKNEKVLASLELKDNDKYTFKVQEEESTDGEEGEETTEDTDSSGEETDEEGQSEEAE